MVKASLIELNGATSYISHIESSTDLYKELKAMDILLEGDYEFINNSKELSTALNNNISSSDIIFIFGGSNEQENFVVKKMLAKGLGMELEENEILAQACEKFKDAVPNYKDYASIPSIATPIPNENSVEQGFILATKKQAIISLPSDVESANQMIALHVLDYLKDFVEVEGEFYTLPVSFANFEEAKKKIMESEFSAMVALYKFSNTAVARIFSTPFMGEDYKEKAEQAKAFVQELLEQSVGEKAFAGVAPAGVKAKKGKFKALFPSKHDTTKEKVRKTILLIACITFILSMGYIAYYYYSSYANEKNYSSLEDYYSGDHLPPLGFPLDYNKDFAGLYKINKDIKGWLEIRNTKINYPVVQSPYEDNKYYLRKDFYQKYNYYGIPFLDYEVDLKESKNFIIYGHNMRDGQMFADLINYKDIAFYKQHPTISFNSVYEDATYKIVSIFRANVRPEHGDIFNYVAFVNPINQSQTEEFLEEIRRRTLINTGVDYNPSDQFLTLSTCTYEFKDARFVIVARKTRPGESTDVNVEAAVINPNPLMPDIWYKLYGGTPPSFGDSVPPPVVTPQPEVPPVEPQPEVPKEPEPEVPEEPGPEVPEEPGPEVPEEPGPEVPEEPGPEVPEEPGPEVPEEPGPEVPEEPGPEVPEEPGPEVPEEPEPEVPEQPEPELPPQPDEELEPDPQPDEDLQASVDKDDEEEEETDVEVDDLTIKVRDSNSGRTISGDAYDIICRMVDNEMGGVFEKEAIKAQAVASLSYVVHNNNRGITPTVLLKSSVSRTTTKAVDAVYGEMLYYGGQVINSTYHAASAGETNDAEDVWGGRYPYLTSVESEGDEECVYFGYETKLTEKYVASQIEDLLDIDPYDYSDDPEDWFDDLRTINGRYVKSIKVCGEKLTGRQVREQLLHYKIKSHAFEVDYDGDDFQFTTYGYGHGVGLSQYGAQYLAKEGWNYEEILEHYFSGAKVK